MNKLQSQIQNRNLIDYNNNLNQKFYFSKNENDFLANANNSILNKNHFNKSSSQLNNYNGSDLIQQSRNSNFHSNHHQSMLASPRQSSSMEMPLSRSASVKSVASDSGVGSSSPLSDCSDYNNTNSQASSSNKHSIASDYNMLNNNSNSNQAKQFKPNSHQTPQNVHHNFKHSQNFPLASAGNQMGANTSGYNVVKKRKNSLEESFTINNNANVAHQQKQLIKPILNHHQISLNDHYNSINQQQKMFYQIQNQKSLHQSHQLQHQQLYSSLQQVPCDKECCRHLNNLNVYSGPKVSSYCDCKECNDLILMNNKQLSEAKKKQIPHAPLAQVQIGQSIAPQLPPPGYCDCPPCNKALAESKKTNGQKNNLSVLAAPINSNQNAPIPTNRFMISSNSSFSPVNANMSISMGQNHQYLSHQQHNINNQIYQHNQHLQAQYMHKNFPMQNTNSFCVPTNQSQGKSLKKTFCACEDCIQQNFKCHPSQAHQFHSMNESQQKMLQKNHREVQNHVIDTKAQNERQTLKANSKVPLNSNLHDSYSSSSLSTAVLLANEYTDLSDGQNIIKQKNTFYSDNQHHYLQQQYHDLNLKRKLDTQLNSVENFEENADSIQFHTKRAVKINMMMQQIKENEQVVAETSTHTSSEHYKKNRSFDTLKVSTPIVLVPSAKQSNEICDAESEKSASVVGMSNTNEDDIELGEVVGIEKIDKNIESLNSSVQSSVSAQPSLPSPSTSPSSISTDYSSSQDSDLPVTISKKMLPIVTTRIHDWLEKSVEFSNKISIKKNISLEKIFSLLTRAWPKLLLVYMIENGFAFCVTKDHSHRICETPTSMLFEASNSSESLAEVNCKLPKERDAAQLHNIINVGHDFSLDTEQYELLREIILFREGGDEALFSVQFNEASEVLKDIIEKNSPNKQQFTKIVNFLPNIYDIKTNIIEKLFCRSLNNYKSVYELLNKKLNNILAEEEDRSFKSKLVNEKNAQISKMDE